MPGALLAISLMIGSYIISKKRHYPKGDKFSVKRLLKQLGTSFWALAAVVIVVVGSSGLTYYRILQTVQWTAHIGSLEIFDNDSVDGLSMVGFIFHTP